ncbi:MAG: STAS domain-containing protein [Candidatus Krumholzibacteria bacterium]|nr:STAS domain-containing protein [Candidatus Krumholzibacteria bacterium]MCK5617880.1 STAS domain-containing protein [Candidatus Krumholzibacteria bacterium]
MKITQREVDNAVVLDLSGKLTGGPDAETFREVFKSLIDQDKKNIIVNLEKVSWINSTGLGILISGYTSVRRGGGDLVIMHASDRIESILYVTKLNLLFKAYESEEAALASFAEKSEE